MYNNLEYRDQKIRSFLGKVVHVIVDRPMGFRHGDTVYPVNYGYIPGEMAGDGEEQDVYILGVSEPISEFQGRVIAAIRRNDDCEDKLVVAPDDILFHQGQIADAVHFQEQFFDSRVISCFEKSCGVLPYRITPHGVEFLLVFQTVSQCWSLPKGHVEAGETDEQAALRELFEETGLVARLILDRTASITYPISDFACKTVTFYLGEVSGTPCSSGDEIDRYQWVSRASLGDYLFPDTVSACESLLKDL
jgi:8-oxo-dGTP pyrophosphatase MutT (NUDIX family)